MAVNFTDSPSNGATITAGGRTYTYNSTTGVWDITSTTGAGITSVVIDTTPQLGGALDVNGKDIVSTSNGDIELDPNGSGVVVFKGNATKGAGQFKLNCEQNSHGITIKGPPHSAAASYTLTLPNNDGDADQVLKTDGSGNLSWTTPASGGGGGGTLTAVASGTLANGDMVVVNSNGTVSAVAQTTGYSSNWNTAGSATVFNTTGSTYHSATFDSNSNKVVVAYNKSASGYAIVGTVSGTSISFGTAVQFDTSSVDYINAIFDSNSNKVVIGYRDGGNSYKGTAIVGTVSGTSISFGTPVVFENGNTIELAATFDSNSNKVVFSYKDDANSSYGTAIVGTVSGTSISFGSPVVFYSGASSSRHALEFDSTNNKVILAYRAGSHGGDGRALVGTVSGTSISFGSYTTFHTGNADFPQIVHDSSNNKTVFIYTDYASGNYEGTAIVGTVSGTSISFGSPVQFSTAATFNFSAHFHSDANKIILGYRAGTGYAIAGTVSGTSISFGTPVFYSSSAVIYHAGVFDSSQNKSVFVYYDNLNSGRGTANVLGLTSTTVTNLTANNYIGISDAAYANSATATIQVVGSIDDAQSGLTAGQSYYVQSDGTLSTTADSPSVFAGTAVSATKLIVKG